MLSGFILSYVYLPNNTFNVGVNKFWLARIAKIYPLYLLGLLLDLPRGIAYFFSAYELKEALLKTFVSFSIHLTMLQSWIPRLTPSWNPPGWSISTEVFFYLIFPFVGPLVYRLKNSWILIFFSCLLPTIFYYSMTQVLSLNLVSGVGAILWRSLPLLRASDFILGIYLGQLTLSRKVFQHLSTKTVSFLFWGSLFASVLLICLPPIFPREVLARVVLLPFFSIMIMAPAIKKINGAEFLRSHYVNKLGNASYALYILHIPLFYYSEILRNFYSFKYSIFYLGFFVIFVLGISLLSYNFIEIKAQKYIKSFTK